MESKNLNPSAPQSAFNLEILLTTANIGEAPGVTYDITKLLQAIKLYEDIKDDCIEAILILYDTNKISSLYPIIGRETVKIKFSNRDSSGEFINPPYEKTFDVIGIEHQTSTTFEGRSLLILKLITKPFLANQKIRISKSYTDTNDKIVDEILSTLFDRDKTLKQLYPVIPYSERTPSLISTILNNVPVVGIINKAISSGINYITRLIPGKHTIYVEPCKNEKTYIVPSQTPFEFIHYLTTNSVSALNGSTNFAFWENKDGFSFKSLVSLGQEDPTITITNKLTSQLPNNSDRFAIITFQETRPVNTIDRLAGILGATSYTHDLKNTKMLKQTLDYNEYYNNPDYPKMNPGSIFVDDTNEMSENNRIVYGLLDGQPDDNGVYDNHYEDNFLLRKQMELRLLDNFCNEVTLAGGIDIKSGDCINVEFNDASRVESNKSELDVFKSGKYVTTKLCHELTLTTFYTHLTISKDSILLPTRKLKTE